VELDPITTTVVDCTELVEDSVEVWVADAATSLVAKMLVTDWERLCDTEVSVVDATVVLDSKMLVEDPTVV